MSLPYTESDLPLFETRFENGHDPTHDKRYNSWLCENDPETAILAQPQIVLSQVTTPVKSCLIGRCDSRQPTCHLPYIPEVVHKVANTPESKVLTSEENLAKITKKSKEKNQKQRKSNNERKRDKQRQM